MVYNLKELNGTIKKVSRKDTYGVVNIFKDTVQDVTIIHLYNGKRNKYLMYFVENDFNYMHEYCIYKDVLYQIVDKDLIMSAYKIANSFENPFFKEAIPILWPSSNSDFFAFFADSALA